MLGRRALVLEKGLIDAIGEEQYDDLGGGGSQAFWETFRPTYEGLKWTDLEPGFTAAFRNIPAYKTYGGY